MAGLHLFPPQNEMFRPKLELHVQFYELVYSSYIIVCLKEEFDLFFLSSLELFLFLVPLFFSFTEHFHILVYLLSICFSSITILIQK